MIRRATEEPTDKAARPLIAHAIYRLDVGGMENGLVNLINGLPEDRYRHAIICVTTSSEFESRLTASNVDVYELNKPEGKHPSFYFRFWRLLRRIRPAILHTRNLGTLDLAPIAMLARVPVRIHGEHGWHAADPFGKSAKYRVLRKVCDVTISEYVAVSKDIEDWLGTVIGVRPGRVRQFYNGVDTHRFSPEGTTAGLPFRDVREDALVIGTVGRLDRIKNFDLLIRGLARLIASDSGCRERLRLVIVGDGSQRAALDKLIVELGLSDVVWMAGTQHDIAALLRAMHLFVLPSRNEGISNTILESMSTGIPVIASAVGGNPELVTDGETGSLIPADDVDAIVEAIRCYLRDPGLIESRGRAARERAERLFSLDAMVRSYGQMYDRLLSNSISTRIH